MMRLTLGGFPMIDGKDLTGIVIRAITLFNEGSDGPEASIDFADGSNFNVCLGVKMTLETKWTRDDGGEPQVLKDYTMPAIPS
jgi:hypothetical protein